ncbi:MAG: NYN domain-containing protein [Elusimicrobia bacterium]|nr:NYN domain-containing protein [Elusimicrobiota bacterium]
MSRHYLVDGTNLARGADYDPRFPAMEERRADELLEQVDRLARHLGGRGEVEVFFDGPARPVGGSGRAAVRFSGDASADELILGKVRLLRSRGSNVIVATEDGGLRREAVSEGARVIGRGELWRLREG